MRDIHCHIIPEVDDGANCIDETIEMATIAQDDGVEAIVATPHFIEGSYELPFYEIEEKVEEINRRFVNEGIDLRILPGQEILLTKNTLEYYKNRFIGGLNKSEFFLFELDGIGDSQWWVDVIYEFGVRGIKSVIAHPERYKNVINDSSILNGLIEEGCIFQLDIGSIDGIYGREVKKCAERLLDMGVYELIGTDAHGCGQRKPILRGSIMGQDARYLEQLLILTDNNERLIGGNLIPKKKNKIAKKKIFSLFG